MIEARDCGYTNIKVVCSKLCSAFLPPLITRAALSWSRNREIFSHSLFAEALETTIERLPQQIGHSLQIRLVPYQIAYQNLVTV